MGQINLRILLFIPNLIGYFRIVLILISGGLLATSDSVPSETKESSKTCLWALAIYAFSAILDMVDGIAARYFKQKSAFGAWLDVIIDTIGRTMLWHSANVKFLSWLIPSLEFVTFCCIHAQFGAANWKERLSRENGPTSYRLAAPSFVQKMFSHGFYSPHGAFSLAGVHCLPIIIVAAKQLPLITANSPFYVSFVTLFLLFILSSGRTYAACCEAWFIADHVRWLLTGPQQMISQATISAIRRQSQTDFLHLPRPHDE